MPQDFTARLRVYAPNGGLTGSLPFPTSWEMAVPLNDMPSLTLVYPRQSPAIQALDGPCEVVLELRSPVTGLYAEYPGCRFLNLRRSWDMIDRPGSVSYTMPSYGWQLKKGVFSNRASLNKEGRMLLPNFNPGQIIAFFLAEAQTAGSIPGITRDFNGSTDSAGVAWGTDLRTTGTYDIGQDVWNVLNAVSNLELVDWRMNGRVLQMYRPGTFLGRSLANDSGVILHPHIDHLQEPAERTLEEVASRAVLIADDNRSRAIRALVPYEPWGQWDQVVQAGGVSDNATMEGVALQYLRKYGSQARFQMTKQLVWRPGSPVPLIDYRPGDYVYARTEAPGGIGLEQREPSRIRQITLSSTDPYGISIALTLNDRFTERQLKNEQWLNRVTGQGGPTGGSGTGGSSPTSPKIPVTMTAKPPTNLGAVSTSFFNNNGDPVSTIEVSFDITTQSTSNESLDIDRYNVYVRRTDLPLDVAIIGQAEHPTGAPAGTRIKARVGPVDAGFTYVVGAQAIPIFGLPSAWSSTINITPEYPSDPPPVPSTPVLSSRLSTVKAEWDGLDDSGSPMPPQLSEVQVELALSASGPWSHVGDIFQPGSAVIITGQDSQLTWTIGTVLYVRFVARDKVSNFSAVSATASIAVQGVTGPDIEANSITANNIATGTLTAQHIKSYSLTVDRLSVGDQSNIIADPLLADADLTARRIAVGQANSASLTVWSSSGAVARMTNGSTLNNFSRWPLVNNVIVNPDLVNTGNLASPGQAVQVTRPTNSATNAGNLKARMRVAVSGATSPGTVEITFQVRFYSRTGAFISVTNVIATYSTTTATDGYIQSGTGVPIPATTAVIVPYVLVGCVGGVPVGTQISLSEFELWQEGSVYIGDGMIKAPLVAADAITTDKLAANAITAKQSIISAFYRMDSGTGTSTIEISANANYVNQAGIRFNPENTSIGLHPAVFVSDNAGSGGWDPNGLIHMGPETTINSSGRVDFQQAWGITNSHIVRSWGTQLQSRHGIQWIDTVSRILISGQLPTGSFTNDMFRAVNMGNDSSANVWTITWGTVNWLFIPVATPGFVDTNNAATNATCLVSRRTTTAVRVASTAATTRMHIFAFSGGYTIT